MLGSGARAAEIARKKGWDDPVAAEHLVIDALANRDGPAAISRERHAALSPKGKRLVALQRCLESVLDRSLDRPEDCAGLD
jgi:hypothetical protein